MSYEPLLSIITVSAFDSDRLARTLNSLIGLPLSVEHVVVIPEEDPKSKDLWESHKDSGANRITLVHDQLSGVYSAMNTGAIAAKGKYICFWNAGDTLNSQNELSVLIENLVKTDTKWAICQGNFEWREKQELSLSNLAGFVTHEPNAFISHQTVIIERATFKKIGMFDSRYQVAADTAQITKLFSMEPLKWEDAVVVKVETPNFASRNHRRARVEVVLIVLRNLAREQKLRALRNILKNELRRAGSKLK